MSRYSTGVVSTGAGTSARPIASLFSAASVGGKIREIGVFNTTTTAVTVRLARLTAQGTPGSGLTEAKHDPDSVAASCTAFDTHTADATVGDDLGYRAKLGAAAGAGVIWTFGESGLRIPVGTANGIGILPVGTGQVCEVYIVWDE